MGGHTHTHTHTHTPTHTHPHTHTHTHTPVWPPSPPSRPPPRPARQAVLSVGWRETGVRYLLTEAGSLVVGGAAASVASTAAGPLEVLPFRALDWAWPGPQL